MRFRDTFERTTERIGAQVRDTADDLIDKLGSESQKLGEKVGDSIVARVNDLSDSALARLNLVTERRARQRMMAGAATGIFLGFLLARFFGGESGAKRREAMKNRLSSINGDHADYASNEDNSKFGEESAESEDLDAPERHK